MTSLDVASLFAPRLVFRSSRLPRLSLLAHSHLLQQRLQLLPRPAMDIRVVEALRRAGVVLTALEMVSNEKATATREVSEA